MMSRKKAIVTGATSFIGQALIRKLLKKEYDVIALIRPGSVRRVLLEGIGNIKILEIDLLDILAIDTKIVEAADMLFHIGWNSDFENPRYNLEGQLINVSIFQQVVEWSQKIECNKIISVGSQAECGRVSGAISENTPDHPETAYAIAKCQAYDWGIAQCRKYGMKLYWPRLLSAYGPYDKEGTMIMSCLKAALNRESIIFTKCEQMWDYIYVDDVAEALVGIAEQGRCEVKYSIASGVGRPLRDYIKEIADITGAWEILDGIGRKEYAENQVMRLVGDIRLLKADTGFEPTVSFTDGIKEIIRINYKNKQP